MINSNVITGTTLIKFIIIRGVRQGNDSNDFQVMNFVCFQCYNKPSDLLLKARCHFCIKDDESQSSNKQKELSNLSPCTTISPDRKKSRSNNKTKNVAIKLSKNVNNKLIISPYRKVSKKQLNESYSPPTKLLGCNNILILCIIHLIINI